MVRNGDATSNNRVSKNFMTATEAFENMYNIWDKQMRVCASAEKDYNAGRISLANYLEECFLLVYECARLGMVLGAWPREVADEAALVITRNWRKFIEAIPDLKRRVLSYENVDARTRKQQMAIESKWRKALDMIEDTYDYGDFEPRPAALAATFF